ncbi:hypothetical protein Plim_1112 [Planctopirus limnophila DSM 3776]|uniref:Uncharacterized protein n=1 Tax=Planctopirus limnophila (strain ATCC 43296 / DSM 3776 / IFAM 1008 / Mu 290) TaxID=521674 RepID=D5STW2_PLAL2|nr:hypothetical protein Plim_1112 [Planctopirus limnophila DSM 3776]
MDHLNHVPLKPLLGKPAVPPCRADWGIGRHLAYEDVSISSAMGNMVRTADPTVKGSIKGGDFFTIPISDHAL